MLSNSGAENLRCMIFVERVVTSIVLSKFLSEALPKYIGWKCEYIAGRSSRLQSLSRKLQNEIFESFHKGMVNVIVATSILEEGLYVQSCNIVTRFDPCPNDCSLTPSRGRSRKEKSDFQITIKRNSQERSPILTAARRIGAVSRHPNTRI
uniref:Helicase C-terminal domain-containing protein n=1 Tax=Kalanchoe fedtschenkoi TaxID=63787 RepID=A0A7N0V6F8_KALFE